MAKNNPYFYTNTKQVKNIILVDEIKLLFLKIIQVCSGFLLDEIRVWDHVQECLFCTEEQIYQCQSLQDLHSSIDPSGQSPRDN